MRPQLISNENLSLADLPEPNADWSLISAFALTFNGYVVHGSFQKCAEIANGRHHETLTDLRTCLFFEQRRWRHFGDAPAADALAYIQSLVEQIRNRVASSAPAR